MLRVDFDPLVVDCNGLLKKFDNISVIFIRRTVNVNTHNLVGLGRRFVSRTWLGLLSNMSYYSVPSSVVSA